MFAITELGEVEERKKLLSVFGVAVRKIIDHLQEAYNRLANGGKEEDYLYKIQRMMRGIRIERFICEFLEDVVLPPPQ